MSAVEESIEKSSAGAAFAYPPSQLELIRTRLQEGHDHDRWYLAGELATPDPLPRNPGFSETSEHDFYVAPLEPQLEADALNRFTGLMLGYFSEFAVYLWQTAREHPDGGMGLPRARLAQETVGQRITTVTVEAFVGPDVVEEPEGTQYTRRSPIVEDTRVRVFPDPSSAQVVFYYAEMMRDGTLDDSIRHGRSGIELIAKFHELEDCHIEALKHWYSLPANQPKVSKLLGADSKR